MGEKHGNKRQSQWRVVRRCLDMLLRLMCGPASTSELLTIVNRHSLEAEEKLAANATKKRFEQDRERLRTWFGCELRYENNEYTLVNVKYPLMNLPDDAIRGLAFLQQTFSSDTAPMRQDVQALIETIIMILPNLTQKEVDKQRGLLEVELQARDADVIGEDVWQAVQTACAERRQLEFDYRSPQQEDRLIRRHLVEPIRYFFDTVRGHYYFEAFWIESRSRKGVIRQEKVSRFRMGRMTNPQILPKHFPPNRRIPTHELIYELSPDVARLGVTQHFPNSKVIHKEDGGAEVHVPSRDLFFDLRTLLYYGPNCRIIGGKEAVSQMKELLEQMYKQYF